MQNRFYISLTCLISMLVLFNSFSGEAQEIDAFDTANQAYEQKQYNQAIKAYHKILESGYHSAGVYFNLGNAYYKDEQLGSAILYFERALKLSPNDDDIHYNLSLARGQLKDDIVTLPPFFLTRWWVAIRSLGSSKVWSIWSIVFAWLGIAGWLLWLFGPNRKRRKQGFLIGMVLILLCISTGLLAYSQASFERNSKMGIILVSEVALQTAPDTDSKALLQLHEGSRVYILDRIGTWYKVQLDNGEKGWLPEASFEQV